MKIHIEGEHNDPLMLQVLALLAGTSLSVSGSTFAPATVATDDPDEAPPATPADPSQRDSAGLPWDERIHSKSRGVIGDGTWRKRKGVQSDLVTAVEAELRARAGNPTPPVAPAQPAIPPSSPPASTPVNTAPPPSTSGQPAPSIASPSEAPPAAPVAAPPATPPAPAPVAPPAVAGAPTDFSGLMQVISNGMASNKIDKEGQFIAWMCSQPDIAVGQITEIAANPTKIAAAYQHLVAQNRI